MSLASSHSAPAARKDAAAQLCVVIGCHHLVCALPIRSIDRLALPDAAQRLVVPTSKIKEKVDPNAGPLPAVVQVGADRFAAWDLGSLLGLGPLAQSWVLLRVSHGGKEVPLALRTGPCLAVQGVRKLMKLPPGIFRTRRSALTDGFAGAATKGGKHHASVGLWLEPARLWEPSELQASIAALARAEGVAAPVVKDR